MYDLEVVENYTEELIEVLDKIYENKKYANLPTEICYNFEAGYIQDKIMEQFSETGKLCIDYDRIESFCRDSYGSKGWESQYDLITGFYKSLYEAAQNFLDSKFKENL